jgi:EAL domain-containing protein (putative c-di-GMP-specific phosphodiesterase class I)
MPICEAEPWRMQYCESVDCPPNVNIPTEDADDATIVSAIITLGHNLGLKVVAEGVEQEEQVSFLRLNQCDEAQGFIFCRPIESGALADKLTRRVE